jgi:hypothetical protein
LTYAQLPVVTYSHFERAFRHVRCDSKAANLDKLREFHGQTAKNQYRAPVEASSQSAPKTAAEGFAKKMKQCAPKPRNKRQWAEEEAFIARWEERAEASQRGLLTPAEATTLRKQTSTYHEFKSKRLFVVQSTSHRGGNSSSRRSQTTPKR